ncbi:hypothetical protein BN874_610017 [Candidatus Contendobacter odensis Run_B_J11]|uniref:Uncharacterized protein n=1 Tax=Candidatus Contendobacter odensis Run_B_J11 TaxID=1400861 RepID=A0A7U7J424_9GAMM|nr:hypothetical protein BN874_610017 [Candidatus Contendobacter odensis Run_B_J11]
MAGGITGADYRAARDHCLVLANRSGHSDDLVELRDLRSRDVGDPDHPVHDRDAATGISGAGAAGCTCRVGVAVVAQFRLVGGGCR